MFTFVVVARRRRRRRRRRTAAEGTHPSKPEQSPPGPLGCSANSVRRPAAEGAFAFRTETSLARHRASVVLSRVVIGDFLFASDSTMSPSLSFSLVGLFIGGDRARNVASFTSGRSRERRAETPRTMCRGRHQCTPPTVSITDLLVERAREFGRRPGGWTRGRVYPTSPMYPSDFAVSGRWRL